MKIQNLIIDGALHTRVAAALICDISQEKAFEQKDVCEVGGWELANDYKNLFEQAGWTVQLVPLSWFFHPNLPEQLLSVALFPDAAPIILVRVS